MAQVAISKPNVGIFFLIMANLFITFAVSPLSKIKSSWAVYR